MTSNKVQGFKGADRLSHRAQVLLERPRHRESRKRHNSETSPAGYICLNIAQNKLSAPLIAAKVEQCRGHPSSTLSYDRMIGSEDFRHAVADFFARYIFRRETKADRFAAIAGAGSVLDVLAMSICERGENILLHTPTYRGFKHDVGARAGCGLSFAHSLAKDQFRLTLPVLKQGLKLAQERHEIVRAVLLCSPVNPTGQVLSASELVDIVTWCRQNSLHCIVDEIYALSVYGEGSKFVSVREALDDAGMSLNDDVHVVWSFSKDFCANGYRVGILYTENPALLKVVEGVAYFSSCSTDTQATLTKLLKDEIWVEAYIEENIRRLRNAYEQTSKFLQELGVSHLRADAGFFVWCNFNGLMQKEGLQGWPGERQLANILLDECGVALNSAELSFCNEPGWFRYCFAAVSEEDHQIAKERIAKRFLVPSKVIS